VWDVGRIRVSVTFVNKKVVDKSYVSDPAREKDTTFAQPAQPSAVPTQAKLDSLRIGMTYDQVATCFGFPGRLISRRPTVLYAGGEYTHYAWSKNGETIFCMFRDGKLYWRGLQEFP
jgi:hypothetical protein